MAYLGQLHIERALTNVSVAYKNGDFVAAKIFPEVPVEKQADKYFVYGMERFQPSDDARRPGAVANEINWGLSNDAYYCDGHALKDIIPDEFRKGADEAVDLEVDSTETTTDKILLNREVNLVAALAAGMTPVDLNAVKWSADANDPVKVIDTYKETVAKAIGKTPNILTMSRPVFRAIRNNALVKARISGAQGLDASHITAQQLASVLEVDELIVAEAVKATSKEGQATTMDYIWGTYALLSYRPPSPGRRTVSLGYHFVWNIGIQGALVKKYRSEERSGDTIEVQRYYDQKIVAAGAGVLFSNCV
jgi:hypothetical protein